MIWEEKDHAVATTAVYPHDVAWPTSACGRTGHSSSGGVLSCVLRRLQATTAAEPNKRWISLSAFFAFFYIVEIIFCEYLSPHTR